MKKIKIMNSHSGDKKEWKIQNHFTVSFFTKLFFIVNLGNTTYLSTTAKNHLTLQRVKKVVYTFTCIIIRIGDNKSDIP